jgi:hypothetical protein
VRVPALPRRIGGEAATEAGSEEPEERESSHRERDDGGEGVHVSEG